MTIFRRLSKNSINGPTVLEASPRPSAYMLGDFDSTRTLAPQRDDDDSMSTVSLKDDMEESQRSLSLAQAFSEFSVKMDDKDDSVQVFMDVPPDVPVEDLTVQVDDGILRVSGDVSSETEEAVEQAFQLDEQSLALNKMTASLSNGVLTITAPKKDSEGKTLADSVPIKTQKPPKVSATSYKVVIVDVPGVHKEDIHVSYANGKLRVAANRHFGRVRSFKRTIPVDIQQFDANRLQTYLHQGRLAIMLPPKEECVLHTIDIETKGSRAA